MSKRALTVIVVALLVLILVIGWNQRELVLRAVSAKAPRVGAWAEGLEAVNKLFYKTSDKGEF